MNEIPIIDLKKQYQSIQAELDEALQRVFTKGIYILGDEVDSFEKEFAQYCNASYAIGVASGTDALTLSLLACDLKPDDEVIAPSHTAVASIASIELAGAKPVLVDIDIERYTLDPRQVEKAITKNTRAIMPVHLYGCPADMTSILQIARHNNLLVIEDCAQGHGAKFQGQRTGVGGDVAAFSFYPTKNLGAFGDGGMIVTNDSAIAQKIKLLRQYGWQNRYVSQIKGMNSRLDELHASMLRVKLKYLDAWNARRRDLANLYIELLQNTEIILPVQPKDCEHVFHQFVIRHPQRDALKDFLTSKGIHTLIHYPMPVHLQPAYENLGYKKGSLPNTEKVADEVLSLPMYPELTEAQVEFVAKVIIEFSNTM